MSVLIFMKQFFRSFWFQVWGQTNGRGSMNLNDFAKKVTLAEGGRVSVSIAQVKEIMRIVFRMLARMRKEDVDRLLKRFSGE